MTPKLRKNKNASAQPTTSKLVGENEIALGLRARRRTKPNLMSQMMEMMRNPQHEAHLLKEGRTHDVRDNALPKRKCKRNGTTRRRFSGRRWSQLTVSHNDRCNNST